MLEAAPNPISEKEEYTPALLATTQCTMFPDLIKILHLSISGLPEPGMLWPNPIPFLGFNPILNPIYTPAIIVTTQFTMFPDLIKILHLSISGLSELKMPWHP